MKTRISARFVVGHDGTDHVVYRDGEVVYQDDRVLFVGHDYGQPVDRDIEAGDALVGPGFIDLDALADIDHAIIDCWQPPDLARGLQWSEDYFRNRRHDVFSADEEIFKRCYALVQLLLNGVTTAMPIAAETHKGWAEPYSELAAVAEIAAELGIRMYLGPAYRSGINVMRADGTATVLWDEPLGEAGLRDAVRFVRDFDGAANGLIRGALLPCRIETMTLDLMRETRRWSDELGCPVRIHAAQGPNELRLIREWHDRRPIELLNEIGMLGPRTSIPHVLYVRERSGGESPGPDELPMLAESGTTVIHCPMTSARHGRALESFDRYLAAGVNLAMGTDTFPPDMIRVLDYGSNIAKIMDRQQHAGQPADLYRAATLGGARALGRDDLGRLAPGAEADLVVVDFSQLRGGPIEDPIRTLLFNTGGPCVRTVVVDGRTVVDNGRVVGVDDEALRVQAQAYFEKMVDAYPERDYLQRTRAELFPTSFRTVERPSPGRAP
ncbi:MAG: chlorohydrolase family protein [Chloroflexota bacterium]